MIERAAKAIFAVDNSERPSLSWDDDTRDWERDEYRIMARAAIEAMRQPTRAMCLEGSQHIEMAEGADHGPSEDARNIWQAMIDAALKETSA